ncbi:MAG: DUF2207 domain-containing protein [Bacilli bacterium]
MRLRYYFKNNIIAIIIAIAAILFPFIYTFIEENLYENDSMIITSYEMQVVVEDDGSMLITEREHVLFEDGMTVYFRDIGYGKNNDSLVDRSSFDEDSIQVRVYDSNDQLVINANSLTNTSTDSPNTIGYSWRNDIDELGDLIRCPSNETECVSIFSRLPSGLSPAATFEYTYRIQGAVTAYEDIAELNWIFSPNWGLRAENITVSLSLPNNTHSPEDIYFFGHGTNNGRLVSLTNNEIVFENSRQLPGEVTEARILFPLDIVPNIAAKNTYSLVALDLILEEEQAIEREDKLYYYVNIAVIVVFLILYLLAFWLAYSIYLKYDKELKSDFYGEYYRELPANYPPAEMGFLYRYKEIIKEDVSATLMDLIRRHFIDIDYSGQSLTDKKPNYTLIYRREKDSTDLKSYEKYLLKWFFDIVAKADTLTLNQLEEYTKKEKNAITYYECNRVWIDLVKKDSSKNDFFDKESENVIKRYAGILAIALLISVVAFLLWSVVPIRSLPYLTGISIAVTALFTSYIIHIKRRSKQGNEEYVRWHAFKKFLEEFSHFDDYPMPSITIWEHYLVYAVSFGIADLVEKQLRFKFKQLNREQELQASPMMRYPMFHTYMHMRMMSNFTTATTTINKARAQRVGSGSGSGGRGGFGGGRSFGGGGGGARGR